MPPKLSTKSSTDKVSPDSTVRQKPRSSESELPTSHVSKTSKTERNDEPPKKLQAVTPSKENSDPSDESTHSEDVEVLDTAENEEYERNITMGKLARIGFRHPLWNSKYGSFFVILAYLYSYDTFVGFSANLDRFGAYFCIVYGLVMMVVGVPLLYMEFALGQYTSSGVFTVFDRIAPAFAGIGITSLIFNFWVMLSDQMLGNFFMTILIATFNLFEAQLPWHHCNSPNNDDGCHQTTHHCRDLNPHTGLSPNVYDGEYQYYGGACYSTRMRAVHINDWYYVVNRELSFDKFFDTESFGQFLYWNVDFKEMKTLIYPTGEFYIAMGLTWACVYFASQASRENIFKLAMGTVFLTSGGIFILAITSQFLAPPKVPHLHAITNVQSFAEVTGQPTIWMEAFFLVLRSLKLGQGGLVYLGSQQHFHNSIITDCMMVVGMISSLSITYGFMSLMSMDSFTMWLAGGDMQLWTKLEQSLQDPERSYLFYVRNKMIDLPLLSLSFRLFGPFEGFVLFGLTLSNLVGMVVNKVVCLEIIASAIIDKCPTFGDALGRRLIITCTILFAAVQMLCLVSQFGLEYVIGLDKLVAPILSLVIVGCNLLVISMFYGPRRLFTNITSMLHYRKAGGSLVAKFFSIVLMVQWSVGIPVWLVCAAIYKYRFGFGTKQGSWLQTPKMIVYATLLIIPIVMIVRILRRLSSSLNVAPLFKPHSDLWGPRSSSDRQKAQRMERQVRAWW